MKLCLSLLKDELPFPSTLHATNEEVFFSRFELFHEEQIFDEDMLVVMDATQSLGNHEINDGSSVLCLGSPPDGLDQSNVPILSLAIDADLNVVVNELLAVFKRYDGLENSLTEAVLEGRGLQTLVDIMHPFVVNELNIVDSNHRMIAHSFDRFMNLSQSGFEVDAEKFILPVEVISFFTNNKRWIDVKTEKDVFIYDEGIFANRLLCKNIIHETEFVCRIIIGETELPFRSYDTYLLNFFYRFVRLVYGKNHNLQEAWNKNTLADVLRMMLSGQDVELWRIEYGLSLMHYEVSSRFLTLCIRPEYGDYSGDTLAYYCESIPKLFPGLTVFEYDEDIVCLVNTDYYESSSKAFLKQFTTYSRDNNFRFGVSEEFSDVKSFTDYYTQAEIAVSMGLENNPTQWVYRYHEHAIGYIIKQAIKKTGAKALCSEKILKLHRYDQEHESEYVLTLACFLNNSLNATETAKRLNIHRSTLLYRLNRIEDISEFDFDDPSQNLFYGLSIELLHTTDK